MPPRPALLSVDAVRQAEVRRGEVIDFLLQRGLARLDDATDDDLVALVAQGDETACRLLVDRHLSRVIAVARRMMGNQADAEEVAQEVFLRVWTHADRWEPGRAPSR